MTKWREDLPEAEELCAESIWNVLRIMKDETDMPPALQVGVLAGAMVKVCAHSTRPRALLHEVIRILGEFEETPQMEVWVEEYFPEG